MRQEMMMGFWDAMASAGPYAKNLHLAPGEGGSFSVGQAPLASPLAPGWPAGNWVINRAQRTCERLFKVESEQRRSYFTVLIIRYAMLF